MKQNEIENFQSVVWGYYNAHKRDLPWRKPNQNGHFDPYKILVSEIMLQQTQVNRVIDPYDVFIKRYPTVTSLASSNLGAILGQWQGLGYNRRAKYLHESAKTIVRDYEGHVPEAIDQLQTLPGVGVNTAGAVIVYAYNIPFVFIETNIRTVYIHHFFSDQDKVHDSEITKLVDKTMKSHNPREWYWALMDYGSNLKKAKGNTNQRSKGYRKQSKFEGSDRQLRGKVIRLLTTKKYTKSQLLEKMNDIRAERVIETLVSEGMIRKNHGHYCL